MRTLGIIPILFCFGFTAYAQDEVSPKDSTFLRLDIGFDIGFGRFNSTVSGDLPVLDRFLLQNNKYGAYSFTFPEINLFFYNRIGLRAGTFASFFTDKTNFTETELQAVVPDYYTQTDGLDNQSFFNSTKDAFSLTRFKLGLSGLFRTKKIMKVMPYADVYFGLKTTYPKFDILMKEKNSNEMFTRTYEYKNLKTSAYAFGLSTRFYSLIKRSERRKVNYFINLNAEMSFYKTSGISYYTDSDFYGNTISGPENSFVRKGTSFKIGFCITGIGFQFLRKN